MKTTATFILLLLVSVWLAGCGFQPRGELPQLSGSLSPMQIKGINNTHPFRRILEDRLVIAGIKLTDDTAANSTLRIHKIKSDRVTLSVDNRNKTVEYEISNSVDFSLLGTSGTTLTERQKISARQILFNPGDDLLGRTQEETLLRRDMYEDIANRIITRIKHQAR
ncbi:MAG: LPS-assembly lipoprotein LptE [bacterium]